MLKLKKLQKDVKSFLTPNMFAPLRLALLLILLVHGERMPVGAAGIRTRDSMTKSVMEIPNTRSADCCVWARSRRPATAAVADDDVNGLRV